MQATNKIESFMSFFQELSVNVKKYWEKNKNEPFCRKEEFCSLNRSSKLYWTNFSKPRHINSKN